MKVKHSKTSDTTISLLFTVPSSSIAHQLRPVSGWCKSRKEHNLQGSAAQAARASGVYTSLEIWNKTQLRRNPCHVIHWVSEGDSCQGQAKTSYKVSWVAWMCDKDWQSNIVWPRYWCDLAALALAFHILSPRLQAETVDTPIMGRVVPGVPLCFLDLSCRDRMGKPQSQCRSCRSWMVLTVSSHWRFDSQNLWHIVAHCGTLSSHRSIWFEGIGTLK